ncbi:solute carrier family 22 member 3-like isoform X3 [Maniola hyperantus]|uniref:solute carrier family 22 member 3-like isoform X3 n=1 Tax=Aphantopus hyperantus TaxID=2795564 RepID=UPI0037495269
MPENHSDSDDENTSDGKNQDKERTSNELEKPMSRDDLLRTELGEFGWFQLRNLLILTIAILFCAVKNDYIVATAAIPHRCQIAECGENSRLHNYNPDWILNAVPKIKSGFSSCDRYAPTDSGINGSLDYCPPSLFNHTNVISCEDFVYANDHSLVYDFNLGCNEWLRVSVGAVGHVGLVLGLPLTGYISDRFGRKVALVFNIFSLGLVGVIRAFSVNYTMYMILEMVQTIFGSSVYPTAFVLASELVGPKYRYVSVIFSSMYSLGQVMLGGVFWLIGSWRYATLAVHIPCLFMIVYYWLLSESIRWLLVKEKYVEARKIIETAAKLNKKSISDKSMEALLKPQQDLPHLGVGMYTFRLIAYLLGKVGATVALTCVNLYTSELYPTECRHTLLAFSSTVGQLGAIAAPLTPALKQYWHGLPSVLFGVMGFLAGATVFTQPETLGTKLPDTFAEAEMLGKPDHRQKSEI